MQLRGRLVLAGGASLIAFLLAACGSGGSNPPPSFSPAPPAPDFSLSVSSGSISVEQGATSGAVTVTVNPINGFTGSVSIAVEGLPAGVTSSPASPFSVAAGQSQQVTFSTSTSVVDGSYALTLRGTSGALSFNATLTLTVTPRPDFSLSVSPNSTSVEQGATSQPVTVSVSSLNGFAGSVSIAIEGLPQSVTSSPASPFLVPAGSTQQVTFSASTSAPAGLLTVTFRATSGTLFHSAPLTLTVVQIADFAVSVNPTTVSLPANGTASVQACVNATTSGSTNYTVDLSYSTLPQEVTGVFDSSVISLGQCAVLTLTATKDAPEVSSFPVTVTATRASDGTARTADFLLTVTRIALGGGDINYTLDNANGLFPSASQTCFTDFMNFLAPLRDSLFDNPDTPSLTVTVRIDPTIGEGGFRPLADEMLLGRAPTCQSDTFTTLGTIGHEDGHASHRTYLRLTQQFPGALESFREEDA